LNPIDVGILGATGTVGQQFVRLLERHPWFRLTWLAASERSAGQRYGDLPWRLPEPRPESAADRKVEPLTPGKGPALVFSALDASVAGDAEASFAGAGHSVVSNARNFRMDPLVPLLVPEINPHHLDLLPRQRVERNWRGAIVTNPNCSTVFLAMALAALRPFHPSRVVVTTMQALSGAGYPGVASLDAVGNVVPFIAGEEEKLESEPQKILGEICDDAIIPHPVRISAQTTRVPVIDGHTETVSVELGSEISRDEMLDALRGFSGEPQRLQLPSAPNQPVVYRKEHDHPQPRLDVNLGGGMAVQIGRLRPCPILGWKFVLLGHNTIRGAAGAAILNAELLVARGL
jgi:aspartate-semialdehyde dehydrogenase